MLLTIVELVDGMQEHTFVHQDAKVLFNCFWFARKCHYHDLLVVLMLNNTNHRSRETSHRSDLQCLYLHHSVE